MMKISARGIVETDERDLLLLLLRLPFLALSACGRLEEDNRLLQRLRLLPLLDLMLRDRLCLLDTHLRPSPLVDDVLLDKRRLFASCLCALLLAELSAELPLCFLCRLVPRFSTALLLDDVLLGRR